jgi:DNA-binding CsgD family transcriptional regulator
MNEQPEKNHFNLTGREIEVLNQLANGLTCQEIAKKLFISLTTVISHRNNLKNKMSARNTSNLVFYGCKRNII